MSNNYLTIGNDGNGDTYPAGKVSINPGETKDISATPKPGYHFVNWARTGGPGTVVLGDANLPNTTIIPGLIVYGNADSAANTIVTIIDGDATIRANFAIKQYNTLTIGNDGNGDTTPTGDITVNPGETKNISATPKPGYHFVSWTKTGGVGTVILGDANLVYTTIIPGFRVFGNADSATNTIVTIIDGDAMIRANFAINQYTLTIGNDGKGDTNPTGNVTANHGAGINISATPKPGYKFVNWTKTGGPGTAVFENANSANTTVTVTEGDITIRANFVIIDYTLTIGNDGHGSTNPTGNVTANHGAGINISATPKPGYKFVNWTKTGGPGTAVFENANSANTTVTVTEGDITIRANFVIIGYTLTIGNDGHGSTTPTGNVTVNYGASTNISAHPHSVYYSFEKWTKTGGSGVVVFGNANAANTTVTLTDGDATIRASFCEDSPSVLPDPGPGPFRPPYPNPRPRPNPIPRPSPDPLPHPNPIPRPSPDPLPHPNPIPGPAPNPLPGPNPRINPGPNINPRALGPDPRPGPYGQLGSAPLKDLGLNSRPGPRPGPGPR